MLRFTSAEGRPSVRLTLEREFHDVYLQHKSRSLALFIWKIFKDKTRIVYCFSSLRSIFIYFTAFFLPSTSGVDPITRRSYNMRENHRENHREKNWGKLSENHRKTIGNHRKTIVAYQTNGVRDEHEEGEKSLKRRNRANEGEVDPMKEKQIQLRRRRRRDGDSRGHSASMDKLS